MWDVIILKTMPVRTGRRNGQVFHRSGKRDQVGNLVSAQRVPSRWTWMLKNCRNIQKSTPEVETAATDGEASLEP